MECFTKTCDIDMSAIAKHCQEVDVSFNKEQK